MRLNENGEEDVMQEAVSLIKRIECRYPGRTHPVVLGLNKFDWLFIYFGSDPMYRFDENGRFRRALVDGLLYRTAGRTLSMLERHSSRNGDQSDTKSESYLLRRDLSPPEVARFRQQTLADLKELHAGLADGEIVRQYPVTDPGLLTLFEAAVDLVLNVEPDEFLAPAIVQR